MTKFNNFLILFLFIVVSRNSINAQEIFYLKNNQNTLENPEKLLENNNKWSRVDGVANFGPTESTNWLYIKLAPSSKVRFLEMGNPMLDTFFIYGYNQQNQLIFNYKQGKTFDFDNNRYAKNVLPNYIIPSDIEGEIKLLIKIQSTFQTNVPIMIYSEVEYLEKVQGIGYFGGLYFGILLVMFLYNLFIFLSVKDRVYLYYCIYIVALIATQFVIQGYAKQYLFYDNTIINLYTTVFFGGALGIVTILFSDSFLRTRIYAPKLRLGLIIIGFLCLGAIIINFLGLFFIAFNIVNITMALGSFYLLSVAIVVYLNGYKPAVYFVVAWVIFLAGTIIFVIKDYGYLPYNDFTVYSYQVGSIIEVVMLSLALADRINVLKKEKEKEQVEKLIALETNESFIKNQNIFLEQKVQEKTSALTNTNEELNKTLSHLKNTQVSLVESEKMASLGQLTAGVAHEINNPINFVSSNVKPLYRDIEDINTFLEEFKIQHSSDAGINTSNLMELYKKLDLDYARKEIDELLNGINEGAQRTAEIVRGLKNFSRLDEADFKTASIEEGIESTLILLKSNLKGEIEVVKDFCLLPAVDCFAGKLNQVFMNLINNSIYAITHRIKEQAAIPGLITIKTTDLPEHVKISISDNGCGMTDDTLRKLFEPFYTTKPVGEGTGLGMSITYNIINELHKGKIEVSSELNKGTIIEITLPKNLIR